jgi:hypothetical protein
MSNLQQAGGWVVLLGELVFIFAIGVIVGGLL